MASKRVLIVYRSYFPSVSHLGPATAIRNLIENLSCEYAFHILTLNYEFADDSKLFSEDYRIEFRPNVTVEYVPRGLRGLRSLFNRLRDNFNIVEIHCAFDPLLAIPALIFCRLGFVHADKIFHMPHGIFMKVIMSTRGWRKKVFCWLSDLVNLYKGIVHLAGSPAEAHDISRNHLRPQKIVYVSQFVDMKEKARNNRHKQPGSLRIAVIGRIAMQKNVLFAIDVVQRLGLGVTLDIFGEVAEPSYYKQCLATIGKSRFACKVTFHGHLDKEHLLERLPTYDVLLHPTFGENFGHAIAEALSLGIPVLLSEHSPWIDVEERGAGWIVPLSRPDEFTERLAELYAMGDEWTVLQSRAYTYAQLTFDNAATAGRYRDVYEGKAVTNISV